MTTYIPPQPNAALVVGPDDVLVLSFPYHVKPHDIDFMKVALADKSPGLVDRILFVVGAEQIAVVRKEAAT